MNKHNAIQAAERVTASEEEGVRGECGWGLSLRGERCLGGLCEVWEMDKPAEDTAAAEPEPELTTQ